MRMDVIHPRDPVRLKPARRWLVYSVGLGLWATGVLWLVFHYFLQGSSPFGPEPNPLEFWWRAAHGFFGFASLWTLGLLWGGHIVGAWKSGRHRLSGALLLAPLTWLVFSGYLLYYLGNDRLVSTVSMLHWSVGLLLPMPFLVHRFLRGTRKVRHNSRERPSKKSPARP